MVSLALVLLMLPVVIRNTEEMLRLVPDELREAAYALGIPKWKTILRIVLPTALSGTVTGVMLALARVMGETAPVLVLVGYSQSINFDPFSGNMASLPLLMFSELLEPGAVRPVPHLGRGADAHPHHHDPAARGERRLALLRHLEVEGTPWPSDWT